MKNELKRIDTTWFCPESGTLTLRAGESLILQGDSCKYIYKIVNGKIACHHKICGTDYTNNAANIQQYGYISHHAGEGFYLCAEEYASNAPATYTLLAAEPTVLIAAAPSHQDDLLPLILHNSSQLQQQLTERAFENNQLAHQLKRAENATTLAQMTAGIAHELNNAVGVLARRTDFVASALWDFLEQTDKNSALLFSFGIEDNSYIPAKELRGVARHYEKILGMSQDAARVLAHLFPDKNDATLLAPQFIDKVKNNYCFWEMGHDLRDMKVAAKQATGIVRAVKLLGGGNSMREAGCDITQSIKDALMLLHNKVKHINLELNLQELPTITANTTELVQIWVNFIKNGLDAMQEFNTPNPTIHISTRHEQGFATSAEFVSVTISNNGPPIAPQHLKKIWQANFSTKKLGSESGLGLGLSIVHKIIESNNATVEVISNEQETAFTVKFPL